MASITPFAIALTVFQVFRKIKYPGFYARAYSVVVKARIGVSPLS